MTTNRVNQYLTGETTVTPASRLLSIVRQFLKASDQPIYLDPQSRTAQQSGTNKFLVCGMLKQTTSAGSKIVFGLTPADFEGKMVYVEHDELTPV